MLSERLQILLEPHQRQALDREARRSGRPIGALVREAIDARYDADRERRLEAARRMRSAQPAGPELSPEEIERLIRTEHDH